jgi:hypothetical protein
LDLASERSGRHAQPGAIVVEAAGAGAPYGFERDCLFGALAAPQFYILL